MGLGLFGFRVQVFGLGFRVYGRYSSHRARVAKLLHRRESGGSGLITVSRSRW